VATAVKLTPALFILYLVLTRRWRAAGVATGTFLVATALGTAVAPGESLQYWAHSLWETSRVGRPDQTGNQSLLGMLARLALPGSPSTLLWGVLAAALLVVALRRAVQAARQGDDLVGITLTGLASGLVSPISWSHHLYWFVPACVVLLDVAAGARLSGTPPTTVPGRERAVAGAAAAGLGAMVLILWAGPLDITVGVCGPQHCGNPLGQVGENTYVLMMTVLVFLLPVRARAAAQNGRGRADPWEAAVPG
jgi:alpha-1,2-mannosyltransferase